MTATTSRSSTRSSSDSVPATSSSWATASRAASLRARCLRLHKYLGNPVLSWIGQVLFRSPIGDFHCGLRGFNRRSIMNLHLQTTGMEFASEVVVKSTLGGLRVSEVPTTLDKDGRSRPPHLRSWRDGWRHLRFLLIFSPRWLFLIPGAVAFFVGFLGALPPRDRSDRVRRRRVRRVEPDLPRAHSRSWATRRSCSPSSRRSMRNTRGSTSHAPGTSIVSRSASASRAVRWWACSCSSSGSASRSGSSRCGSHRASARSDPSSTLRTAVLAALFMMLGAQTIMAGMFLGALKVGLRRE